MKAKASQYLNELVSLTVLVLMVLALAAGPSPWSVAQADAATEPRALSLTVDAITPVRSGDGNGPVVLLRVDASENSGAKAR